MATANQIAYGRLLEDRRHNAATEGLTSRDLSEKERHNRTSESETFRHNLVTEGVEMGKLTEANRHNLAQEGIQWAEIGEKNRHNLATEGLASRQQDEVENQNRIHNAQFVTQITETRRHNKAVEKETKRHNQQSENDWWEIQDFESDTRRMDAETRASVAEYQKALYKVDLFKSGWNMGLGIMKSAYGGISSAFGY